MTPPRIGAAMRGAALTLVLAAVPAAATESGMGRYMPGLFATPGAGIVPPAAGFYWQSSSFWYGGSAGRDFEIPNGNSIRLGMSADFLSSSFTGVWVPSNSADGLSFAVAGSLPVQFMKVDALDVRSDDVFGIGDIMVSPMVGYMSGKSFFNFGLRVFAPTGAYDRNRMANIGMNYWTFSPTLGFTWMDMAMGRDFSVLAGFDINTRNGATDYRSGNMFHADAIFTQSFPNRFGVGLFGSVLYQTSDDDGPLADRLDGFRGRSFAVGPVLRYTGGTEAAPLVVALSWAPEFGTRNRLSGDGVFLNISGSF
ncbi:MAG: hypothetical protein DI568_16550 [Sphingomonas sp.]|nr:MAG: hypothetical protein DI568_16550 [Sphingomonas sp.]